MDEQLRLFGEVFDPQSDEEARTLALVYLEEKHADALRAMDAMEWLDVDRVAARLLGREGLTSVEWVYLKMALTGLGNPEARYVMIDEAQDYSQGQLAVLAATSVGRTSCFWATRTRPSSRARPRGTRCGRCSRRCAARCRSAAS